MAILRAAMNSTVRSGDVFMANAVTRTAVRGRVVGRYVPTGQNRWDDFELVRDEGEEVGVAAESRVQVEPIGADPEVRLRIRRGREVLVLRWLPTDEDEREIASGAWGVQEAEQASRIEKALGLAPTNDPRDDMHEYFLEVKAAAIH